MAGRVLRRPMDDQPTISTHVLDTEKGQPAAGIKVRLYGPDDELVGEARTDTDGRVRRLLDGALQPGEYRIEFEVGAAFFQRAELTFRVHDASRSHHVPLLVAPYSIASYRGS
jgi:5-hydroxyisourate hydrolase